MAQDTAPFVDGEHVKITVTGRIGGWHGQLLGIVYDVDEHDTDKVWVDPAHDAVTVERLAPPEWPPRRGDMWVDRYGDRYFALDEVLVNESGNPCFPRELKQPTTLVSRKEKP